MKYRELLKPLTSVRAQLVAFIAGVLLLTMLVLSLLNLVLEGRTTRQVREYIRAIGVATDLVYTSLSEGKYLYNMVNRPDQNTLTVNSESVIRRILVVTDEGIIFDSTEEKDIDKPFKQFERLFGAEAPQFSLGDLKSDADEGGDKESRSLRFTITTSVTNPATNAQESTKRHIYIIVSMNRLQQVKDAGENTRLLVFVPLGMLLLVAVGVFSKRFTRPITELSLAAHKVAAGHLDFNVPVTGPEEVSTLSKTFNEMLVGLRSKRNLEEQLQRAERSAVVGRLASGIAHEIRNPLNFINLSIDHLREAFAPKDESQRASYRHILTTIKDELARLNRLVSDFLSYGRPAKLKIREIDARSMIEEVRDLVKTQAEQQGVKVGIEQNYKGDTKLHADSEQIKTCFSNLMINAIQAMPAGGELNVSLLPNNSRLEIEFADTGVGIEPEALGQIFEPYYSTKDTGIGLGLPLTRKIIEEHGGQISVKSDPGKGTTFTVTLLREPKLAA